MVISYISINYLIQIYMFIAMGIKFKIPSVISVIKEKYNWK